MNRYLVCSDIHGNLENFKYALKEASMDPLDGVIIAGDIEMDVEVIRALVESSDANGVPTKLYIVCGNCDRRRSDVQDMISFTFPDGKKCMLTHGHRYGVKGDLDMLGMVADNIGAQVAIYGHTHSFDDHTYGRVRFINPGALCGGFYNPTYVLMTLYNGKIDILKRTIVS